MKSKTVPAFYSSQNSISSSHRTQTEVPHTGISCTILQLLWWEATMNQMPCIIYSVQRDWKFSAEHTKIAATGYTKFKKTENQELNVLTRLIKPQCIAPCVLWALATAFFFQWYGSFKMVYFSSSTSFLRTVTRGPMQNNVQRTFYFWDNSSETESAVHVACLRKH